MPKNILRYASVTHGPLAHNAAHQFAAKHALCLFENQAVFTFIPKNACSTLRYSLALANGCIESEKDINWIHHNNETFRADLAALLTARYKFVVLRCPFSRLASAYLDKIVGRERPMWELYDLIRRDVDPELMSFARFVDALERPGVLVGESHWRPQGDFLVYRNYDDVFQFENFEKACSDLKAKCGLEVHDARKLTHHGIDALKRLSNTEKFAETPPLEIMKLRQQGSTPSPRSLYSDSVAAKVATLYRKDIALYREHFGSAGLMFS